MSNNPFTLSFGKEPKEYIKRLTEFDEITEDFNKDNSASNIYVITGMRGTGKTVLLSSLYKYFDKSKDFIAVDLNTRSNMLEDLAASIYDKGPVKHKFIKAEFNFSFQGFSITLSGKNPVASISLLLEKMLTTLKKYGKKLVITIDDIDTGDQMKAFAKEFQALFRKDLPIYLIVTGLYNVIDTLEKQEGLTFLQRSQKRYLSPLNIRYIANSYEEIFELDKKKANELANLTKGYAFAYQALGYILFEKSAKDATTEVLREYDYFLEEYVYKRVFSELTEKERQILKGIAVKKLYTNKELIQNGCVKQAEISRYKDSLYKKGICDISIRGEIHIQLPRFEDFVAYYN